MLDPSTALAGAARTAPSARPTPRGFVGIDIGDAQARVVFDRERGALGRGREAALLRPEPAHLSALAARLHAAGVRVLVVVVRAWLHPRAAA